MCWKTPKSWVFCSLASAQHTITCVHAVHEKHMPDCANAVRETKLSYPKPTDQINILFGQFSKGPT